MKLLNISIINSCNYSCYYCTIKRWLVPLEGAQKRGRNLITNAALFRWLVRYIRPEEWIIEIIGGEPGLYPEIQALLHGLARIGYHGLVKTNGSLPLYRSAAFPLIAAWHAGREMPVYYDQIVIIENPDDSWEQKARYCADNGIPYRTVAFDRRFEGKRFDNSVCDTIKMTKTLFINSSGELTGCAGLVPLKEHTIFNMTPPTLFSRISSGCTRCKTVDDVVKFLSPLQKEKIETDYEGYAQSEQEARGNGH